MDLFLSDWASETALTNDPTVLIGDALMRPRGVCAGNGKEKGVNDSRMSGSPCLLVPSVLPSSPFVAVGCISPGHQRGTAAGGGVPAGRDFTGSRQESAGDGDEPDGSVTVNLKSGGFG